MQAIRNPPLDQINIDIVNFARHATHKELQWMAGQQLPLWIQELLRRKAAGEDAGKLIDEFADVCNVTPDTKILP
jgi:hypothetical protein